MDTDVKNMIEKLKEELTLDGRKRVFEDGYKLSTDHMKQKSDPEAFTKELLIEPIISKFDLSKSPERHFRGIKQDLRKVDYILKNQKGKSFLAEAKPLNSDLFDKSAHGAVNQIKGLFRLAEVQKDYEFGIATDGLKWIFIGKNSKVVFQYDLEKNLDRIREILIGKEEVSSERIEEEISKKFYIWYNALLHGGKYKDHENKTRTISTKDCLVENILSVSKTEDREQIAQTVMDRLIFIKFLQSKEIVGYDILDYLLKLDENILNEKLKQLFFSVLNTKKSSRADIDSKFKDIPYLNGSLFVRTEIESRNPDYKIRSLILKEVIKFLDSFKFVHTEDVSNQKILDPEILGYIFERAMTATDRKGTGAYYTPKNITNYISENTVYPVIVKKVNKLLKEKDYKDSEMLKDIEEVYRLRESTLGEVFSQVILNLKICDNACGSGAFLLAAADVLLDVYKRVNDELRLKNSEIAMRKLILQNNLYGVDINPNAIEIAKLRLWLWLVNAYEPNKVEPLPNIDYNIRVGNSLIGYVDISKFKDHKLTLLDWYSAEKSLNMMLKKREDKINEYKTAIGDKSRELKYEIDDLDRKIKKLLDINLFQEINKKVKVDEEEFRKTNPFHWGFEFYNIFNKNGEKIDNGFDIVIGNPPYGLLNKRQNKSLGFQVLPYEIKFYRESPEYAIILHGMINAFQLFIKRSMHLLNFGGSFSQIFPLAFTGDVSSSKLRKHILENYNISHVEAFPERDNAKRRVFEGVKMSVCILTMFNDNTKSKFFIRIHRDRYVNNKSEKVILNEQDIDLIDNTNYSFPLLRKQDLSIIKKMYSKAVRLSEIGHCYTGEIDLTIQKKYITDNKSDAPLIKGAIIDRFLIRQKMSQGKIEFLDSNRYLKENTGSKTRHHENVRIVMQAITGVNEKIRLKMTIINKGIFCANSVNYIVFHKDVKPKYILALLNGSLMNFLFKKTSTNSNVNGYEIDNLPLILADDNKQEAVIKLVDEILDITKDKKYIGDEIKEKYVKKLEDRIDKIIFDIYEIDKEEQKIIEESLK